MATKPAKKPAGKLVKVEHPQAHGGALWRGKAKNHKPGPGRPKNAVLALFKQDLWLIQEQMLVLLQKGELTPEQLTSYFDKIMKWTVGKPLTQDDMGGILARMYDIVVEHNDIEDPACRLTAIQREWKTADE